ncbi:DUF927 domain-containing protein [Shinella sp.]|uniref:DUF927 domain-containing protein n=1 Tax=Shinella sp. TaxID=1870904 RepID=UPI0028A82444|nr:DUF927 domain-containing protein [Shinella sp.]
MEMQESYIIDAINDAKTGPWFKAAGPQGEFWFSATQFMKNPVATHADIVVRTGRLILNTESKRRLDEEINRAVRRDGTVATQAGWSDNAFICGDGCVVSANISVDVVAFDPLPKFSPEGDLLSWQRAVGPYVQQQTLPFFMVALSLSGPLLRFLPSGTLNPIVELAGEKLSGKSTLGALAASVWAGDPEKTEGGGESWNMTSNAFDLRRDDHRDMLLVLDEAEGAGSDERDRQSLAKSVIFRGATTTKKLRMNQTNRTPAPLRLALLSTANTSFREVLRNEPAKRLEAAVSRVLPILVHKLSRDGLALFDSVPAGHHTVADAASELRYASDKAYGTAGPAFAKVLAEKVGAGESAFKVEVRNRITGIVRRLQGIHAAADIRHCRTLAAIELAAYLAREGRVLPAEWGEPCQITDRVFRQIISKPMAVPALAASERGRLEEYVERQLKARKFRPSDAVIVPMPSVCDMTPGFVFVDERGKRELLVEPEYFERTFDGAKKFLKNARQDGRLKTHPSEADRLQIRAPNWMLKYGFKRIYNIVLT